MCRAKCPTHNIQCLDTFNYNVPINPHVHHNHLMKGKLKGSKKVEDYCYWYEYIGYTTLDELLPVLRPINIETVSE